MDFHLTDFNDASTYYAGDGAQEWAEIEDVIRRLPLYLQASDESGRRSGSPIFDPKATNAFLSAEAKRLGWRTIAVPKELTAFGTDWDAGKGGSLAEWQFSNYPFLWNNVIRSEAVYKGQVRLEGLSPIRALIVVTKCGLFPSSNSTLYFEQARAQTEAVTKLKAFEIPIRLIGLTLPEGIERVTAIWSDYPGRYSRVFARQAEREMTVAWRRKGKYDMPMVTFREP